MASVIKTAILCFFFSGLAVSVMGQSTQALSNTVNLSLGTNHHRFIDEAFTRNRLKFLSTAFLMDFSYQKQTDDYLLNAFLQHSLGVATTPRKEFEADLYFVQLAASYARHTADYALFGKNHKLYLGGQLSTLNYYLQNIPRTEDDGITTIAFQHSLNLYLHQITEININNRLAFTLALPVSGFVKRASYEGPAREKIENDYENNPGQFLFGSSKFFLLNPFSLLRFNMSYLHSFSRRTGFTVKYHFNYLSNRTINPIKLYNNGGLVGFNYSF